eukprot:5859523-Pyramimonas_sp.AAC.1
MGIPGIPEFRRSPPAGGPGKEAAQRQGRGAGDVSVKCRMFRGRGVGTMAAIAFYAGVIDQLERTVIGP